VITGSNDRFIFFGGSFGILRIFMNVFAHINIVNEGVSSLNKYPGVNPTIINVPCNTVETWNGL